MATSASLRLQPVFFDFIANEYRSLKQKESGVCAFSFVQPTERESWFVDHNRNFTIFKASVFTTDGEMVIPEEIELTNPDTFIIRFEEPISGIANVLYKSSSAIDCIPTTIVETSTVEGINTNTINADTINGWNGLIGL